MLIQGTHYYKDLVSLMKDYQHGIVDRTIAVKFKHEGKWVDTTVGRLMIYDATGVFIDYTLDKGGINKLIVAINKQNTPSNAAIILKKLQDLMLGTVTRYGLSLGAKDFTKSDTYKAILDKTAEEAVLVPADEELSRAKIWDKSINGLVEDWKDTADIHNPLKVMMQAGARVTDTQVRQMVIAKGLLTSMTGSLEQDAVPRALSDGLSPSEYFKTCGPARRGLANNFFIVPASGYLERQMVTLCRDLTITTDDCGTEKTIKIKKYNAMGRYLPNGILVDSEIMQDLDEEIEVRSPITCEHNHGLCKKCCGVNPANGKPWWNNVGIGVMAAQTLVAPTTQLGLRGKHTSGAVTIKSFSTKIDDALADLLKQLGAAGTVNVKIANSTKLSPDQVNAKFENYEDKAAALVDGLFSTYKNNGINVSQMYVEVVVRAMSDQSTHSGGVVSLRSRGYRDPNPIIRGVSANIRKHPSWLKGISFGYVKANIIRAMSSMEPSLDLPSELILEGRLV